jgi:hypothetical protein
MAVSQSDSSLSRAGHRLCGAGSGKASANIASVAAIALVLRSRCEVGIIALPLCPIHGRQLLTDSRREAGRIEATTAAIAQRSLILAGYFLLLFAFPAMTSPPFSGFTWQKSAHRGGSEGAYGEEACQQQAQLIRTNRKNHIAFNSYQPLILQRRCVKIHGPPKPPGNFSTVLIQL